MDSKLLFLVLPLNPASITRLNCQIIPVTLLFKIISSVLVPLLSGRPLITCGILSALSLLLLALELLSAYPWRTKVLCAFCCSLVISESLLVMGIGLVKDLEAKEVMVWGAEGVLVLYCLLVAGWIWLRPVITQALEYCEAEGWLCFGHHNTRIIDDR